MATMIPSVALVPVAPVFSNTERLALKPRRGQPGGRPPRLWLCSAGTGHGWA
jgi:hypothetical protein